METKQLGNSALIFSRIGLGTWAMGGGSWLFGWGHQDDNASESAIKRAIELGINWIDTAPVYGLGHSETVIGETIKKMGHKPLIATKCSRVWDSNHRISGNLRQKSIMEEVDASLKRLQIDVIDLYQIHWPDPVEQIEEGWDTVARLIEAGKVRYGGVSNFNVEQMKRIISIHPITSLQPPYSMFRRDIEEDILDFCSEHHIGVIPYSPMQKGLLTGKITIERVKNLDSDDHRRKDPMFREPQLQINLDFVDQLKPVAEKYGKTLSQLAIAWVIRRSEVTSAIVGTREPSQIEDVVGAVDFVLDPEDLQMIEALLEDRARALQSI